MKATRFVVLLIGAGFLLLWVAGCGGDGESEKSADSLRDRDRVECEEHFIAQEESFDQPSVRFEEDPYGAAEEFCETLPREDEANEKKAQEEGEIDEEIETLESEGKLDEAMEEAVEEADEILEEADR